MSQYAEANFDTARYNLARPSYPESFYETLFQYHSGKRELAVDIGCGSGFVAFKLLDQFEKVIGTDVSETMISQCNDDPRTKHNQRIGFLKGSAEKAPEEIEPGSVDMLTGAECCHWVDHPRFFAELYRLLKSGGTLAYWFYRDPYFVGYPKANEIYDNYTYQSSVEMHENESYERYMGPYYEQPGHDLLRLFMLEIAVPEDLFTDVVRKEYLPERHGEKEGFTLLYIRRRITLKGFLQYVKSWSAYHTWMRDNAGRGDVAEAFIDELKEELGWDDEQEFDIVFPTVYTFARKR